MGFSESSIFAKVAFVLSIVGALILVIGLATTSWLTADRDVGNIMESRKFGLFSGSTCTTSHGETDCESVTVKSEESWFTATRAFVIIAFLVAIGLVAVLIVWIFIKSEMRILNLVALVLAFVAAGCVFIGVITFGVKGPKVNPIYKLGWSFGFTIVSGIIFIVTGGLLVVEKVRA